LGALEFQPDESHVAILRCVLLARIAPAAGLRSRKNGEMTKIGVKISPFADVSTFQVRT